MNVIPKGLSDFNGASTAWACATRGLREITTRITVGRSQALSMSVNGTEGDATMNCVEEFTEFILTSFYSAQRSSCVAAISLLNPKQINCFDIACSLEGGDHGPLDTSANISIQRLDGGQNAFV
ncbi:hypothetical protein T265_14877, partial [Opisthorchis viverrini]